MNSIALHDLIQRLYNIVWGPLFLVVILMISIILSVQLRFLPLRSLRRAFFELAHSREKSHEKSPEKSPKKSIGQGSISPFGALMTSLAATIGIGNVVGITVMLSRGGLGSLFWLWLMVIFGCHIKFSESLLAVRFREENVYGQTSGGPMYYINNGLKQPVLAAVFCIFGILATFGGGNMIQANAIGDCLFDTFALPRLASAIVIAITVGFALIGGIVRIAHIASYMVPFMCILYLGSCLYIVACHASAVGAVFSEIFALAFAPKAQEMGIGAALLLAIQSGASRGIIANEAGLGTTPIAAAAAKTTEPARQALISMSGTLVATLLIATVTTLTLAITEPTQVFVPGTAKLFEIFSSHLYFGGTILSICLIFFAYSTILGWAYYGEKCLEYLFGTRSHAIFRLLYCLAILPGTLWNLELIWLLADTANGLMAMPNLFCLPLLSHHVLTETKAYLYARHN